MRSRTTFARTLLLVAALASCGRTRPLRFERLEMSPLGVNTYVVADEVSKEAIIVDPGFDVDRIAETLARLGAKPKAVIATHGHLDHVAGAAAASERFAVPFMINQGDKAWLDDLDGQAARLGISRCRTPVVGRWLDPDTEIVLGAHRGRVLPTPGHSEGGCSIVFDKDRVVLTGDTLFRNAVGRTDFRGGSATVLMSSIRTRLVPLGDDFSFYPGHGPSGKLGDERRHLGM